MIIEWREQAITLREEADRIRRTVKAATDAEERCNVRAEIYDKCADSLDAILRVSGPRLIGQTIPDIEGTEPRLVWDCRVCGFGVVEGRALDFVRQNGHHPNAQGNDSPNAAKPEDSK